MRTHLYQYFPRAAQGIRLGISGDADADPGGEFAQHWLKPHDSHFTQPSEKLNVALHCGQTIL
jgi:hypothetical protein